MKKVNKILLIISIIIIALGIIIGLGVSNEVLNSISFENNANGATSGIGADYSGTIQILGIFGAKLIGTMIVVCSIVVDLLIWLFYGLILFFIKILKNIKNNRLWFAFLLKFK